MSLEYKIFATPEGEVTIKITNSEPQVLIRMSAVQADQMSRVLGKVSGYAIINLALHRMHNMHNKETK